MRWLAFVLAWGAAGCFAQPAQTPGIQLYEGPARADQIILTTRTPTIRFTRIDDLALKRPEGSALKDAARFIDSVLPERAGRTIAVDSIRFHETNLFLPPGRHVVSIDFFQSGVGSKKATLWFDGEPARAYLARFSRDAGQVKFWMEDREAAQRVGGLGTHPGHASEGDDEAGASTVRVDRTRGWAMLSTTGKGVTIERLDGASIPAEARKAQSVEIAPGKRIVSLKRAVADGATEYLMWFTAQPGESYVAKSRAVDAYNFRFWLEDSAGKSPDSGPARPSDEPAAGAFPR